MAKEKGIQLNGKIIEVSSNIRFKVQLENQVVVNATVGGIVKQRHTKLFRGDKVLVELSPYDLAQGRIIELKQ